MQIHLLSALLFGVSSNTDNLVVGLSYGMKKMPIGRTENLIVALITFTGTILSMVLGKSVLLFLPPKAAGFLGSGMIILIGIAGMAKFLLRWKKTRKEGEEEHKGAEDIGGDKETVLQSLTIREALFLGLALTLNNVGLGIGASITGLPVASTALGSFFFSLVFLDLGNRIGRAKLSEVIGEFAEPLAAFLMISLGVYEVFI